MQITGKVKNICLRYTLKKEETAKLIITGRNLTPKKIQYGHFKRGEPAVFAKGNRQYRMTDWFAVEQSGEFLVMSGDAYNRAIWQFALANGEILSDIPTQKKYRLANGKMTNMTFPRVRIPKGAVRARVYYAKLEDEETLPLGDRLQIEYGMIPTFYEEARHEEIDLPALEKKRQLVYAEGAWYIKKQEGKTEDAEQLLCGRNTKEYELPVKIACGDTVTLQICRADGTIAVDADAQMQVAYEERQAGFLCQNRNTQQDCVPEYGVRIYYHDPVPVCERIGDAVGMHFNYRLGGEDASLFENDFDHIYPWNAMRRCAVSFVNGKRKVLYEGEDGYRTDGTAGEVMVEIPKHYAARRVTQEYEEILISPAQKEGFVLEPSFLTPLGEADAVYVGAYFAAEEFADTREEEQPGQKEDGTKKGGRRMLDEPAPPDKIDNLMLVSRAGRQVSIYRSGEEFLTMAKRNPGFEELDLCTMLMLQRLFLIESAVLDSQSIFEGNTYMPYLIWDRKATYYASENVQQTNCIRMRNNSISKRYHVGDAVAVMDTWKTFFTEKSGNMQRVITGIEKDEDGMRCITFSGRPVDLVANSTGMSELPEHAGSTDRFSGKIVSGEAFGEQCAHDAFCYRGVENLWGGVWVVLSGAFVQDNYLTIRYPDGRSAKISYELPKQNVNLSSKQFGDPDRMYVKRMGYDPLHPLIALPNEIGDGAGNCSYYCDAWFNEANPGEEYIVTFGGAWDNMAYAGLFAFRASFLPQKRIPFNGARLMCRRPCLE